MSNSTAVPLRQRVPRLAEAAVDRARLTVVPHRRVRAARVPFVTLVSVVLLGGVVGLLLFNTQMQQASFAATALEQQARNLAAREQTLSMEIEQLRDPQSIATRATRMGMVVAAAPAFLDLDTGEVAGQPAPAGPEGRLRITPRTPALPAVLDPAPEVVVVPPEGVLPAGDQGAGRQGDGREDGAAADQTTVATAAGAADTRGGERANGRREGRTSQESHQPQRR